MCFLGKRFSGSTDSCQRCVNCHWLGSDSWRKGMCVLLIGAIFFLSLSDCRAAYIFGYCESIASNKRNFLTDPMHGSTKPWFPATPQDKQLSNFACPEQVLVWFSWLRWQITCLGPYHWKLTCPAGKLLFWGLAMLYNLYLECSIRPFWPILFFQDCYL